MSRTQLVTETAESAEPAPPSTWHMYRAMVGVGMGCGLLIVTVYQLTLPIIEVNKAEALQKAIFQVLPDAVSSTAYLLDQSGGFQALASEGEGEGTAPAPAEKLVYAGYNDAGELAGIAIEAQGMGYQDIIRLMYGYSPGQKAIIGIQVLESKETPGLGDKIETDPDFLKNFERLDVSLASDQSKLAHAIVAVDEGQKTEPWQVDGITGATISSVAIADILNGSAQYWVPIIQKHLGDFQEGE